MASLRKFPGSKNWFACFTGPLDAEGKRPRFQRSTGTADRREAKKIADNYEAAARKEKTLRQIKSVLADFAQAANGRGVDESFEGFTTQWLARRQHETAQGTAAAYQKAISSFSGFLGVRAKQDISGVTRDDAFNFRTSELGRINPSTVNNRMKILRMIFRDAVLDGAAIDNPFEGIKPAKGRATEGKDERSVYTVDELKLILGATEGEWRSMVLLGIYTGQRLGDLAALQWSRVDLSKNLITLRSKKTGKLVTIPMPEPLRVALSYGAGKTGPIHPSLLGKQSGTLSNQFSRILEKVGIREKTSHKRKKDGQGRSAVRNSRGLSFHNFRHTAVTFLKEAGVPMAVVMELIGHDSEAMSEHYTHVGLDALKKAAESFPVI